MNILQNLAHLAQSKAQEITDLPVGIAKAVNRSTPWGQANQKQYNQAHAQLYYTQATPVPRPDFLGQLSAMGAPSTQQTLTPAIQGVQNPGAMQLQVGSFANRVLPVRGYDQQQPQVGQTSYSLNRPSSIPTMPQYQPRNFTKASYL